MYAYSKLARVSAFALWLGGSLVITATVSAQQLGEPEGPDTLGDARSAADEASSVPTTKPAAPTSLWAKATSTTEARLTWSDNATNEWEYRIEARWAGVAWREIGGVPRNTTIIPVTALTPGKTYFFRVRARNAAGSSVYSNESAATAFIERPAACVAGPATMCLQQGRYQVTASYDETSTGVAQATAARAIGISEETGLFWFFDPANIEAIVKVHDGCVLNERTWVFTTGLTNLRVLVLVVDTHTGATATYLNEKGKTFIPVQDTDAFASCGS